MKTGPEHALARLLATKVRSGAFQICGTIHLVQGPRVSTKDGYVEVAQSWEEGHKTVSLRKANSKSRSCEES